MTHRRGFLATVAAALGIGVTDARFDRSFDPTLERMDAKCRRVVSASALMDTERSTRPFCLQHLSASVASQAVQPG